MKFRRLIAVSAATLMLAACLVGCGGEKIVIPEMESLVADPNAYEDKDYGFQLNEKPAEGEEIAIMHTSMGDIHIRFFPEAAPKAVANFKLLAQTGAYDGLTFHRVIENFMIQGGDPKGDGTGGESIWKKDFADEFNAKLLNLRGSLVMANSGPNTNGSQFFINQAGPTGTAAQLKQNYDYAALFNRLSMQYQQYASYYGDYFTSQYPSVEGFVNANLSPDSRLVPDAVWELYAKHGGNMHLDGAWRHSGGHTVFGQVYEGMDVIDAIAKVDTDSNDKPLTAVTIKSIEVMTYTAAN